MTHRERRRFEHMVVFAVFFVLYVVAASCVETRVLTVVDSNENAVEEQRKKPTNVAPTVTPR